MKLINATIVLMSSVFMLTVPTSVHASDTPDSTSVQLVGEYPKNVPLGHDEQVPSDTKLQKIETPVNSKQVDVQTGVNNPYQQSAILAIIGIIVAVSSGYLIRLRLSRNRKEE